MDKRLTWTDCYEAADYVVSNVFSQRDLVSRPVNMDETVPHTHQSIYSIITLCVALTFISEVHRNKNA